MYAAYRIFEFETWRYVKLPVGFKRLIWIILGSIRYDIQDEFAILQYAEFDDDVDNNNNNNNIIYYYYYVFWVLFYFCVFMLSV